MTTKQKGLLAAAILAALVIDYVVLWPNSEPKAGKSTAAPIATTIKAAPLTEQEQYDKRHAEQLAALDAAQAAQDAHAAKVAEHERCRQDIKCWSDKYLWDAEASCIRQIEQSSKWQYEWTNSILGEPKFSAPMWVDRAKGSFGMTGRAIKMQNGFGAWKKMHYQCVFDPETNTALASVSE